MTGARHERDQGWIPGIIYTHGADEGKGMWEGTVEREVGGKPGRRHVMEAERRDFPGAEWLRESKSAESSKTNVSIRLWEIRGLISV